MSSNTTPTPNNPDGKSLLVRILDKLKSKLTSESKVIVEHIEQEFIDLREDFKKEIARLEAKIEGKTAATENPSSTATASTAYVSSMVAAQNADAVKATV